MLYSTFSTLSWLLWLLVGTALFGFMIGLTLFLLAYFYYRADLSWKKNVILTIIGVCFVVFLASVLNRDLPPGLLQHFVCYIGYWCYWRCHRFSCQLTHSLVVGQHVGSLLLSVSWIEFGSTT